MNRTLGCTYLMGSIIWFVLMVPFTTGIGLYSFGRLLTGSFGDIELSQYPYAIAGSLLSVLFCSVTFKFGISLIKSSWSKIKGEDTSLSAQRKSTRLKIPD